jgi:hypothetical protein
MCMSIPQRIFIILISGEFLIFPNKYWTLDSLMTTFPWIWVWIIMMAWSTQWNMCKMCAVAWSWSFKTMTQCAWYKNLEPNSIKGFGDLYTKLVAHFSTSIPTKKTSIELLSVAQQEGESTQVYWKRSNVEMLKVKELIESIALEALTRGVKQHVLWRKLYVLLDRARPK